MTITACIVTYRNDPAMVAAAVGSCACPVVIVDNDSGAEYVARLKDAVDCEVVSSGANKGFGFGHNVGFEASGIRHQALDEMVVMSSGSEKSSTQEEKISPALQAVRNDGSYHLVLNPDVVLHDGALEAMVGVMEADPSVGLVVPKVLYPDGRLQPLNKRLPSVFDLFARRFLPAWVQEWPWVKRKMDAYIMMDVGYDAPVDVLFASGCCMLFKREALEAVGGFDEGYFMYLEDADICMRLREAGYRVVYTPDAVITHHWARGSHASRRLLWVMVQSMWHHYNKWGWKWI